MVATIEARLRELNINLPATPPPVVEGYVPSFVPFVRSGKLIHFSGRLAKKGGQVWRGKVGGQLSVEEGRIAARGVAVELLSVLRAAAGELDHVRRIVRLLVFVHGTPEFEEPHVVANAASELFLQVFGERGQHARSALCAAQLPFGACVEIEMVAEID
jgi:enamine deaminase RidA (YjgF/YER057c/UK114 family)